MRERTTAQDWLIARRDELSAIGASRRLALRQFRRQSPCLGRHSGQARQRHWIELLRRLHRLPVIRQHDVPQRHTDVRFIILAVLPIFFRRQTQGERQRILGMPFNLGNRFLSERIYPDDRIRNQPHDMATSGICIVLQTGQRALDLLEDQHASFAEIREVHAKGGPRSAGRKTTLLVAPRIELHLRMVFEELNIFHHFENDRLQGKRGFLRIGSRRKDRVPPANSGQQPSRPLRPSRRQCHVVAAGSQLDLYPHTRVTSLERQIVHQAGVSPDGQAATGRSEIGLRGHGVLLVTQVIRDIGQELDERNAEVSRRPLRPRRDKKRETIQHNPPEARIVLGQIVDIGFR